jgi:hypothetical protein
MVFHEGNKASSALIWIMCCWSRRCVFFGINRIHRAFGNAHGAVDALIRVDGEEVGAFAEAVHRANIHTVGVLALDTGFGDDVGHFERGGKS